MKRIIVATLTALMAVGAMAQEFNPIPLRWKWILQSLRRRFFPYSTIKMVK